MKNINDVTLVTIETMFHKLTKRSLEETLKRIPFKNVLVFSDQIILSGAKHVKIEHGDLTSYVNLLFKGIVNYIDTSHIIFQQWDSMIHEAKHWDDSFLEYDYIGAPWVDKPEGKNIGNGGFSLRSFRLLEELQDSNFCIDPKGEYSVQEDNYIGIKYRPELESRGIKFAPTLIAKKFSTEYQFNSYPCMAHHGLWSIVKYMPADVVKYFIQNIPDELMTYVWANGYRWKTTCNMLRANDYEHIFNDQYDRILKTRIDYYKTKNIEYTEEDFNKELNDISFKFKFAFTKLQ